MNQDKYAEQVAKWKGVFEQAEGSGIGIRNWCKENGVTASQYYYWHKRLVDDGIIPGRSHAGNPPMAMTVPVFAEIDLDRGSIPAREVPMPMSHILESQIAIQRKGFQIFVGEGFSSATLGRVLEVIGNVT